jgi:ATP-dependent helicase/nuclease subunit A
MTCPLAFFGRISFLAFILSRERRQVNRQIAAANILDEIGQFVDNDSMSTSDSPPLTDQQRAAIFTHNVSVALSAGAGCGKTFVLTQRFLSQLEPGPWPARLSELVAITFTDRAAREMRDRIRSACRKRLQTCPPEQGPHWLEILYGLDAARITTIHSFCAGLLRSHAAEAGLDPRFTLFDVAQTAVFLERSAEATLHRLLERQDDDAHSLVLHYGLERSRNILAELIGQRFRTTPEQLAAVSQDECRREWPRIWQEEWVPQVFREFFAAGV